MKLHMDVETEALERNTAALAAMTRKTAHQCVRDTSVMVLQAGANLTPQAKKKRRDVMRCVRRYRRGVEELVRGGRIEAPGDKLLWMIARPPGRRPISRTGDRRFWVFETAQAAREHQAITYRGIGKAGFWMQLPRLGKPVPAKYQKNPAVLTVSGLSSTEVDLDSFVPTVTVSNTVQSIQRYAETSGLKTHVLSSVTNRIAGMAKSSEKRLAAFRSAGGVAYDAESDSYETLED